MENAFKLIKSHSNERCREWNNAVAESATSIYHNSIQNMIKFIRLVWLSFTIMSPEPSAIPIHIPSEVFAKSFHFDFDGWQKISFDRFGRVKFVAFLVQRSVPTYIQIRLVKLGPKMKCISAQPLKVTWDILRGSVLTLNFCIV